MFNIGVFFNEIYRSRRSILISVVIMVPLMAMFAGFSNLVIDQDIVDFIKSYPQAMLKAFNIDPDMFGTFEGWTAGEPYVVYVLILGILAAMMGSSTISKELDQHTGEALFTLPIKRRAIFLSKAASHLVQITILFILSVIASLIVGSATTEIAHPLRVVQILFVGYLMALAFAGVGYAVTSFLDSERTAMSVGVGLVLVSFALNVVAAMGESIQWIAKASLFHLLDATVIARGDGMPLVGIAIALVIYFGGLLGGVVAFSKRDVTA